MPRGARDNPAAGIKQLADDEGRVCTGSTLISSDSAATEHLGLGQGFLKVLVTDSSTFSGELVFEELCKWGVWEHIKSLGPRSKTAVETDGAAVGVRA